MTDTLVVRVLEVKRLRYQLAVARCALQEIARQDGLPVFAHAVAVGALDHLAAGEDETAAA